MRLSWSRTSARFMNPSLSRVGYLRRTSCRLPPSSVRLSDRLSRSRLEPPPREPGLSLSLSLPLSLSLARARARAADHSHRGARERTNERTTGGREKNDGGAGGPSPLSSIHMDASIILSFSIKSGRTECWIMRKEEREKQRERERERERERDPVTKGRRYRVRR